MDQQTKDTIYEVATSHLARIITDMQTAYSRLLEKNKKIQVDLPKVNEDNKIVQQKLLEQGVARARELEALIPSPYFTRCSVSFGNEVETLYFGKFTYTDAHIYSWITPAASIRFKAPGSVSYTRPDGTHRHGTLEAKDQYLITDGRIVYLSTETMDTPRELVYQEYFSKQKRDFVLPEIVAQMEAAQDAVIRANHRGPMCIAGPAGSGKTTLALHRVAYLAQSPDVAELFVPKDIIVFVQDVGTKAYFAHLLPELGIRGVTITTFAEWAMNILGLEEITYQFRIGNTEKERDMYEFAKRKALTQLGTVTYEKNIFDTLAQVYAAYVTSEQKDLFAEQIAMQTVDRFDLTILLTIYKKQEGHFTLMQEYLQMKRNNEVERKMGRFPIKYSLMIFDEFQNYLPEQIRLAKSTLDETLDAVMYVGDVAQQTQIGTLQNWSEIPETVPERRQITLQKVYRNTKQILTYIQSLGYTIQLGEQLRDGKDVVEVILTDTEKEIHYIRTLAAHTENTIGVLSHDPHYLDDIRVACDAMPHVHVLSMHEAQGVEFDVVCIVGISEAMFDVSHIAIEHRPEKVQVTKDVLYVALTRAMNELHILGTTSLTHILKNRI